MSTAPTSRFGGKLSLNVKILASLIAAMIIGLAATAFFISRESTKTTTALSLDGGEQLAYGIAAEIQRDMNSALALTEMMRDAIVGLKKQGFVDRAAYVAMLDAAMSSNPQFIGVWTAWEPGAFDSRDGEYINADGKAAFPLAD